jgi:hypothetical protein
MRSRTLHAAVSGVGEHTARESESAKCVRTVDPPTEAKNPPSPLRSGNDHLTSSGRKTRRDSAKVGRLSRSERNMAEGSLRRSRWRLEGKKQSNARSFGREQEIVDCRMQKRRLSGWIGSTNSMMRFCENLRVGTKPNCGIWRRDYGVKRGFRTFFHKVSSILSKSL